MAEILMFKKPNREAKQGPLYYPDDTPALRKLIKELTDLKYFVRRPSKYQIKHKEINFWPSTGTIAIDGVGRHPEKGRQAFLAFLKQTYPKHPGDLDAGDGFLQPPLVIKIDLDDEEEKPGDDHSHNQDGDLPW
jgi:hypothetical protein